MHSTSVLPNGVTAHVSPRDPITMQNLTREGGPGWGQTLRVSHKLRGEADAAGLQATTAAARHSVLTVSCRIQDADSQGQGTPSILLVQMGGEWKRAQRINPQSHCPGQACSVLAAGPAPGPLTSTILLIRPVPTVILPVALPPIGDAVAILTRELEVAGAVWDFRGVFWGDQTHHQSFALHQGEHKAPYTRSVPTPEISGSPHIPTQER